MNTSLGPYICFNSDPNSPWLQTPSPRLRAQSPKIAPLLQTPFTSNGSPGHPHFCPTCLPICSSHDPLQGFGSLPEGFPGGSAVRHPPASAGDAGDTLEEKWEPTPVLSQRSLVGYSPCDLKESDTTEATKYTHILKHTHTHTHTHTHSRVEDHMCPYYITFALASSLF